MMSTIRPSSQRLWIYALGAELIAAGFLLHSRAVELMFHSAQFTTSSAWRSGVLAIQIVLIALGFVCLLSQRRELFAKLTLATVSGLVCLGLNTLFIQWFYHPPTEVSGWRSWSEPEENNELGFRGQPIRYGTDDFVILLVGDSQVEAMAAPYARMPERQLEDHFQDLGKPARVFTIGASGYGQDQQLLVLQEYFQTRRADLVLLWQTPGNDFWNNMFPTHWPANGHPKPTFWLEHGQLHGPNHSMGESVDYSPLKIVMLWQRGMRFRQTPRRDEKWETRLPPAYEPRDHYEGPVNTTWERLIRGSFKDENLATEKSHVAHFLTPPSPRMDYALRLTRELLIRINGLVNAHGAQLLLFQPVFPSEYFVGLEEEVYLFKERYYRASARQAEVLMQRLNQGFDSLDIPVTVPNWRVNKTDRHLNEHANDQVMRDLARALEHRVPAPRSHDVASQ
jgi:hypothetical protein